MSIAVISGTSRRLRNIVGQVRVRDYYSVSPLFRYQVKFAEQYSDKILVASVGHGLVGVDELVEPNNITLDSLHRQELDQWKLEIQNTLLNYPDDTEFDFYLGRPFKSIMEKVRSKYFCMFPVHGMSIGEQLHMFKRDFT